MSPRDERILRDRLVPSPRFIAFHAGPPYRLETGCPVRVAVTVGWDGLAREIGGLFQSYWAVQPKLAVEQPVESFEHDEAYRIRITGTHLTIEGKTRIAILHGLRTLRQLAEPERGVETISAHLLPPCVLEDVPALDFRGVHLCLFPETPFSEIEQMVRLAAQYKFRHVVLECWGTFPFESHPWFGWAEHRVPREQLGTLVALSRDLGITLIPQLNVLGHAAAARARGGKHATLDLAPEHGSLFEPDGWSWCLTNPHTRRILTDLLLELCDFFGNPPYVHLGCDEADNLATCSTCRTRSVKALVKDHLLHFHRILRDRNIQTILWHDMLVANDDPRWKGYTACGVPDQGLEDLHRELPKDLLLADWQYDYPEVGGAEPHWPTAKFFKEQGFPLIVCPWDHEGGIRSLGKMAVKEGLSGLLATTWDHTHNEALCRIFHTAAKAAWERVPDWGTTHLNRRVMFGRHLRMVGWDMGVARYRDTGSCRDQLSMVL